MAYTAPDQSLNAPASAMPRDAELADVLQRAAKEAQEQMHFHQSQAAMWGRVSRAALAGLETLHADEPMEVDEEMPSAGSGVKGRGW